jgi:hypothetical protein
VSLRDPATLSVLWVKIVMLRPAANELFPVNEAKDPPFALPETFEVGMLCPDPSVKAAVVLLVNAYKVIVSGGTEMSHCVVMVIAEPPEPMPFRGSVKLTAEGAAEIVRVCPDAGPTRHKSAIRIVVHEHMIRHKPDMTIPENQDLKTSYDRVVGRFCKSARVLSMDRRAYKGETVYKLSYCISRKG